MEEGQTCFSMQTRTPESARAASRALPALFVEWRNTLLVGEATAYRCRTSPNSIAEVVCLWPGVRRDGTVQTWVYPGGLGGSLFRRVSSSPRSAYSSATGRPFRGVRSSGNSRDHRQARCLLVHPRSRDPCSMAPRDR